MWSKARQHPPHSHDQKEGDLACKALTRAAGTHQILKSIVLQHAGREPNGCIAIFFANAGGRLLTQRRTADGIAQITSDQHASMHAAMGNPGMGTVTATPSCRTWTAVAAEYQAAAL